MASQLHRCFGDFAGILALGVECRFRIWLRIPVPEIVRISGQDRCQPPNGAPRHDVSPKNSSRLSKHRELVRRRGLSRAFDPVLRGGYGPLPVFSESIRYSDITLVEYDRSGVIDGWGIHWVPGRRTTRNLWGFGWAISISAWAPTTWRTWSTSCVEEWRGSCREIRYARHSPGHLAA